MGYRIGIDAGSKTVKVVVADGGGIVRSLYERHRGELLETLREAVHDMAYRLGDVEGPVAVTGSAGIAFAEALGLPFVQEVVAVTRAVRGLHPDADCIIELGGEDAKVVYLTGTPEQRMNATCAGGTGGFIEAMAHLAGVRTGALNNLAMGASTSYPIASRCAVFATSDVRPLLNAGAKPADIAASALDAVVRQTLGGLACGRPIEGKVVFLGGPLERIPALVTRFRKVLGLDARTGIKPRDAHLYTALGACMLAGEPEALPGGAAERISLKELERRIDGCPGLPDDMPRLEPLFGSDSERAEFNLRHRGERLPRRALEEPRPPLFLGVDAGSTTVKLVLVDSDGFVVRSDYRPVEGDVLKTASSMLADLRAELERDRPGCNLSLPIAHATVTGYGEDLLRAALGIDSGVVETVAHLRGAQAVEPGVSFVLDIGGQDMKALWVKDGRIADAVLNEACSSGCGSFIEGAARSLRLSPEAFSREALGSERPLDLGARCTVFMTSRIRHAQKAGASRGDIAAGAAYSVVRNVVERLIGRGRFGDVGGSVVVQGGAFRSDAVLRAFEKETGIRARRPAEAHLMGAYGCALIARERFEGRGDAAAESGLLPLAGLREANPKRTRRRCGGCSNRCTVTVAEFGGGRASLAGNRCGRAWESLGIPGGAGGPRSAGPGGGAPSAPNAVGELRKLRRRHGSLAGHGPRGALGIGIVDALNVWPELPFWRALFAGLGFSVVVPDDSELQSDRAASAQGILSESVCQAAKLSHARLHALGRMGADVAFAPVFERGRKCPVTCGYAGLLDGAAHGRNGEGAGCAEGASGRGEGRIPLASPLLSHAEAPRIAASGRDRDALFECLSGLAAPLAPLGRGEFEEALGRAVEEQRRFEREAAASARRALEWVCADDARRGVVLDCRPYLLDPEMANRIDEILAALGIAVVPSHFAGGPDGRGRQAQALPESLWKRSGHLEDALALAAGDARIEVVAVRAFGCGYDAVAYDEARDAARSIGARLTELVVDEMADTSHLRIRLRTLAETMGERPRQEGRTPEADGSAPHGDGGSKPARRRHEGHSADALAAAGPATPTAPEGRGPELPSPGSPHPASGRAPAGEDAELHAGPLISADDVALARTGATRDLCFTVKALSAHVARMLGEGASGAGGGDGRGRLAVPRPCRDCLERALPYEVSRLSGLVAEVEWTDASSAWGTMAGGARRGLGRSLEALPDGDGERPPLVGLVGNPLLVFDPLMNEGVAELLGRLGCEVAWPDPAMLDVEDVRYGEQLGRFAAEGVDLVIYLLSFGCLKGHVQAHGAARWFKGRFPDMPVAIIEYDPESSALNRENRIRLAVASIRARSPRKSAGG